MDEKINNQKVSAVIKSFENWIKSNTDYWLPCPNFLKGLIKIPYHRWYAGITKYSDDTRLRQHISKNDFDGLYFKIKDVGTKEQANLVESYFSKLGTKNNSNKAGAKKESVYAYVFKADANIAEKIIQLLNT